MKRLIVSLALLILGQSMILAQRLSVEGKVIDVSQGGPLPGVAVLDKASGNSAITDMDGNYTISVDPDAVLTFMCMGMQEVQANVNGRTRIDVEMKPDMLVLEDVLVVAYGTSTKETFTGSAETVSSEKLKDKAVSNVTKMLDGQVAGVMTTSGSGQPGSGADILIRGFGSINASNSPLFVVDGVPFDGELSSLNSNDIESISVLKDASAGALYGARGANGVVIVTTKSGAKDGEKLNINFSAKCGVNSRAVPFYDTLSAREYMELMYRASYNDLVYTEGLLPADAMAKAPDRLSRLILGTDEMYNIYDRKVSELFDEYGHIFPGASMRYDENWLKMAQAKLPLRQEYQFSISGSSEMSKYMSSLGYLDEKGTLATTGFKRYNARLSSEFTPTDWFEFGANVGFSTSRSDFLGSSGTENTNVWYSAMLMAPIYPVYMKDASGKDLLVNGEKAFDYGQSRPAGAQNNRNSVATLYDDDYYSISDDVSLRTHAAVKFGGFKFSTSLGADANDAYETTNYNPYSGNAAGTGRLTKENARTISYTWNQLLSYNYKGGSHTVDAMAGHEFYKFNLRYMIGERTGFPFYPYDELAMGSTLSEANSAAENYAIDSYLFRTNYSCSDKYYASVSVRTDASSRFKKENRWGVFWSAGASWRISEEPFLKDVPWVNNLTLKASYGVQGNDNLGSYYAWQSLYDMNYPNSSYSGAIINSLESPEVTWEKNGNLNTGIEFRLLNKFTGTVEWYRRKTTDLLLEHPLAISLGFPGYYANVGEMVNSGFDITLGADIFSSDEFYWNVTLMGSTVNNRVLSLTGDGEDINNGVYLIREGEPINTFYMARSAGVDPATGEQLYLAYEKDENGKPIEGSEFVTNDSTVASGCKWLLGSRIPKIYGSLSSSLRYGGFDMSLMFTYSLGGKVYDSTYYGLMEPSFVGQTYHRNTLRAWKQAGDISDVPRVTTTSTTVTNDRFLVDASYFTVKSAAVGYTFPSAMLSKIKVKSLRVYLSGDNLYLLTGLRGMNPQANFTGSTSYTYTPNRTVSLGVDLKF